MKGFVIAILAATTMFILAAILWRPSTPSAAQLNQHPWPAAATLDRGTTSEAPDRPNMPAIPVESTKQPAMVVREPAEELTAATTASPDSTKSLPAVASKRPDRQHTPAEQLTLEQTSASDTSLRNADYPSTYISSIRVDLTSPNHWVRLTWAGPEADSQETGPFHSSPGRGLGNNDCDDVAESRRDGSNCTPKGVLHIQGFSEDMATCPQCKFVTWIQIPRGIAFHYYPSVPNYPASHGCVRLKDRHAAQLIHNNSKIGATEVTIEGKWTFVR